jgi:hypothetical protein
MLIPFVSSKPVRLTTSSQVGNKVFGCVVCRFRVAASKAKLGRGAIYKLFEAVAKPVRITFSRIVRSSPDRHTLVLNWGKTCCYIHQNLLLGFSNLLVIYYKPTSFLAPSNAIKFFGFIITVPPSSS